MNSIRSNTTNMGNLRDYFILRFIGIIGVLALLSGALLGFFPRSISHAAPGDWSTYLADLGRSGFNGAETTLNPTTAPHLKLHWSRSVGAPVIAEPVVANGYLYWGSSDGLEHASDPATGLDVWTANLGQTSSCLDFPLGVISTATIASVPIQGVATSVVFVGGGNGQLYALNANTGAILWQTLLGSPPSHFLYSSPAVFNGSVYMGISSFNDCPLVQGQMIQVDASTGAIQHVFNVVPNGCIGGSVWSSPTVGTSVGRLFFSTGNGQCKKGEPYSMALVSLHASDLSFIGAWQIPPAERIADGDFGSTPTLFQATINGVSHALVGLVNKNGYYYAFDRSQINTGPLWHVRVAEPGTSPDTGKGSIASSSYDRTRLYVAGAITTINGEQCAGSLRALKPSDGTFFWQVCLDANVLAPVVSVPGLVVVGAGATMSVLNSATGETLFTYHDTNPNADFWGAASISQGMLYIGNLDGYLYAFGL